MSVSFFNKRTWRYEIPALHYALGICLIGICFYAYYTHTLDLSDFYAYFRGFQIVLSDPSRLYDTALYTSAELHSVFQLSTIRPYIYPPFLAIFFSPLGYLKYEDAYIAWIIINIFLSLFMYHYIGKLAESENIGQYKALFQSLSVGLYIWAYVLYQGQVSILLALLLTLFFLMWRRNEYHKAMFCLALGSCIKFQYCIPLLFFIAGRRRYSALGGFVFWIALIFLASTAVTGWDIWKEYTHSLARMNAHPELYNVCPSCMLNVRGLLSSLWPEQHELITLISFALYCLETVIAMLLGHYSYKMQICPQRMFPGLMISSLYFSPWFHIQDYYLLLPVFIFLLSHLSQIKQSKWLLLPYLTATFAIGHAVFLTLHKFIMIFLLGLGIFTLYHAFRYTEKGEKA